MAACHACRHTACRWPCYMYLFHCVAGQCGLECTGGARDSGGVSAKWRWIHEVGADNGTPARASAGLPADGATATLTAYLLTLRELLPVSFLTQVTAVCENVNNIFCVATGMIPIMSEADSPTAPIYVYHWGTERQCGFELTEELGEHVSSPSYKWF